jgi:hypothetical protein
MELTNDEAGILKGALGLRYAKAPYRNRYCAPVSGETRARCESMADRGLLSRGREQDGGTRFFHATEAGARAMGHDLPAD